MNFNNTSHLMRPVKGVMMMLIGIAALFMAATAAHATITVVQTGTTYPTIQAAVSAAATTAGDTIQVSPGTYSASGDYDINPNGKNVTIESTGGAANTIIDIPSASSTNQEYAIEYTHGEGSSSVLEGFTIENAWYDFAAVDISDSSPTIEQCIFKDNTGGSNGGAIDIESNSSTAATAPMIEQCQFYGNVAGNTTNSSGFGGGIEVVLNLNGPTSVNITNCSFVDNTASYDGGAIDVTGFTKTNPVVNIVNCSFTGNVEDGYVSSDENGTLNPPAPPTEIPGAIDSYLGEVTITNSILWGDAYGGTDTEFSMLNNPATNGGGTVVFNYNDYEGGYSGSSTETADIAGNPDYSNAGADNLEIPYNSPAINKGTTTGNTVDILGNPRGSNVDMGAYQYTLTVTNDSINPTQSTAFNGAVATFVDDTALTSSTTGYSASIDWGDGNTTSGTISQPGGSGTAYSVSGSHTYTTSGAMTLTVTITANTNAPAVTGSDATSITVNALPAPSAPTGLTATAGVQQVELNWGSSSTATSYNVYRGNSSNGESGTPIKTGLTTTSYTDTGLTPATTYYYKVAGVNGGGTGSLSGEASATPTAAAPTVATAASATPNPVTGTTTALSVLGAYSGPGGEANLTYTWSATGPATVTYSANGTNAAKSSTATFSKAGSYNITATIANPYGGTTTSAVSVTVNQTLTSITVTPNPVTVDVGASKQFSATAYDQFANALTTQPTFTWSETGDSGGSVNSSGIYQSGLVPATVTVKATSGAVNGTASVSLVDPGPSVATAASATPNPVTGTTTALSVLGADDAGESVLSYTWSATGPAAVTYSANGTNAAKNSTATFSKTGSYVFTVTIANPYNGSTTSVVDVTVNQTLTSITVSPNPVTLDVGGGDTFTAIAYDQFANALGTQPTFAWSVPSGVGSIGASSGIYTCGLTPGSATVKATSGAVSGTSSVTVADPGPSVATAASATPNPVFGTTTALSVLGSDDAGESVLSYTWSATGPATVTYSANGTNAAKNSTATFSKAGSYVFTVTIANPYGGSTTSVVDVTVGQTLTTIKVTPSSKTLDVNGSQDFSATALDQFGNVMTLEFDALTNHSATPSGFIWSVDSGGVGSIGSSSGVYDAGITPGSATVRATSGAVSGTAAVTVIDPGPSVATAAAANPNPVTGTTTALSVLGADGAGESVLSYTWSATGPAAVSYSDNGDNTAQNTTATFTVAGAYVFTVTIANPYGGSTTSVVDVTVNQTLTSIAVSPNPVTLNVSGGDTFTAIAYDQFDNALGTQPTFAWSVDGGGVGSIGASSGIYACGSTPGSATVRATSGAVSGTSAVTVTDPGPSVATAASANPNPVTGTTTALSVLGADDAGESVLSYTWSATGPAAVTYSDNGDNSAKNATATFSTAGSYILTVTIANPYGGSTTSVVDVTVNQTLTTITVSPTPVTLNVGSGQTFSATAYDQFSHALTSQPAFTWSVDGGGVGSIGASSGIYACGLTPGSATVRATSGSVSGTAAVTVIDPGPSVATAASANPNPATGTTTTLSVLGSDLAGQSVLSYTWAATGPAAVTYSDNGDNTAQNTTAIFTAAGSYVLTVTIANPYGGSTTSVVDVTVNQTLTSIVVSPNPVGLDVNGGDTFTAIAYDQFGTALGTQPTFAWSLQAGSVGSIDPALGIYSAGATPGSATVIATSGAVSGTAAVTVTDVPSVATAASANPNPVTGTTTALSVLGADVLGESTLTYTWSATGPAAVTYSDNGDNTAKNTTATFSVAGAYVFTATITNGSGQTITSVVDVTVNATLTSVTVTPGPSESYTLPALQQFNATAYDQFGNPMTAPLVWSLAPGSVGSVEYYTGLYHGGSVPGTATIRASLASYLLGGGTVRGSTVVGISTVTLGATPVTVATAASAVPNPANHISTRLSVLGAYVGIGGPPALTYSWSATGPAAVTYSDNDDTTARNTTATFSAAGVYNFTVTISSPVGTSTTSSVSVTVDQTLSSITVTPGPMLTLGPALPQTQQFTGTADDQFGNPMSVQPTISWTLASGGVGSISSTGGLYHSGTFPGSATVKAKSGGLVGTCAVTVN